MHGTSINCRWYIIMYEFTVLAQLTYHTPRQTCQVPETTCSVVKIPVPSQAKLHKQWCLFDQACFHYFRIVLLSWRRTVNLKGELKRFFLSAQSFYWPQTKTSFKKQFSPKSPKVGQKSGQRVQNWPNKNQVASDLLRESTDSVLRAAEGIHQFCPQSYWGNPLVDNFSLRPAEGIHRFCPQSYWGNPSILSSDLLRESTCVLPASPNFGQAKHGQNGPAATFCRQGICCPICKHHFTHWTHPDISLRFR